MAGGVVAGAVGEHMWDKHEERERAPSDEVGQRTEVRLLPQQLPHLWML